MSSISLTNCSNTQEISLLFQCVLCIAFFHQNTQKGRIYLEDAGTFTMPPNIWAAFLSELLTCELSMEKLFFSIAFVCSLDCINKWLFQLSALLQTFSGMASYWGVGLTVIESVWLAGTTQLSEEVEVGEEKEWACFLSPGCSLPFRLHVNFIFGKKQRR